MRTIVQVHQCMIIILISKIQAKLKGNSGSHKNKFSGFKIKGFEAETNYKLS